MTTTRATLLERVRDPGDAQAWEDFYRIYSGLIYRYARQRGLNDTDALEVVGESLEALSRRMRDFDYNPQKCRFRNYLRTIVANKVITLLRKKKPQQADSEELSLLRADEDPPDALWDRQWALSHMLSCWARLEREVSPLYAEAFRLCVMEELSAGEVAARLGISANHVSQIKVRMTQRLREAMSDQMEEL